MTLIAHTIITLGLASLFMPTVPPCLDADALREQDAGWERAYLEGDSEFLETHLADEFVWVHSQASVIDTKETLLATVRGRSVTTMRARVQSDVETRRLGTTAIVMGYTVVERPEQSDRYRFMRTYAATAEGCFLLANQTMAMSEAN